MHDGYLPLIIIGAARSGTKLLRDLVAQHPLIDKVPYDINYIWRLGNGTLSHDELAGDSVRAETKRRIRRYLSSFHDSGIVLVEKTVSNCLRVPFVQAVLPDALFIHLLRDGCDVVESAYRQWCAPPNWSYIVRKARRFPLKAAPGYALAYATSTERRVISRGDGRHGTWGPRYDGMDADLANRELLEVCAIQWTRCVEAAQRDLGELAKDRVLTVQYEEFVREPRRHLVRLARFVGISEAPYRMMNVDMVSEAYIGEGSRALSREQQALLASYFKDAHARLDNLNSRSEGA